MTLINAFEDRAAQSAESNMHARCQILRGAFECHMIYGHAYEAYSADEGAKHVHQHWWTPYHDGIMLML